MTFRVQLSRRAERYLSRLDVSTQRRMKSAIASLAEDPFRPGSKPLAAPPGFRSIRVGPWRVVYSVDGDESLVRIHIIGTRGQVYRGL